MNLAETFYWLNYIAAKASKIPYFLLNNYFPIKNILGVATVVVGLDCGKKGRVEYLPELNFKLLIIASLQTVNTKDQ